MKNSEYSIYESDELTVEEIAILQFALERQYEIARQHTAQYEADMRAMMLEDDVLIF
jgi:hypothetical protein